MSDYGTKKPRDTSSEMAQTVMSSDTEAHIINAPSAYRTFLGAIREPMAEFFGVALLVIFGAGAGASVVTAGNQGVSSSPKGDFLSINFGWAVGLAIGVWVSAGISGGHINPAITLAMATWRKFPWYKVPGFIIAQFLGGLVGAGLIYGLYFRAIDIFEGPGVRTLATAGIFATFPMSYMTSVAAFFTEFLATAILCFTILALTDKRNTAKPAPGLLPMALFVLFLGIGVSLGTTGWALNPARDFGPRVFLAMAGYGKALFTTRSQYWLWGPIIAPILGAQSGAFLYDVFLYTEQGVLNPTGGQ
ncbi:aquaporin [Coprinellus micaceus]|uniref:Aquaporin n=1 Tax=Coprinellus micaceus TaxID=71717 RepID=A0A4Y7SW71_COPMI|nr:aquaporin [Coprinellus micaceus]